MYDETYHVGRDVYVIIKSDGATIILTDIKQFKVRSYGLL